MCSDPKIWPCRVLEKLYRQTLGPYWDERRRLIESHYEGANLVLSDAVDQVFFQAATAAAASLTMLPSFVPAAASLRLCIGMLTRHEMIQQLEDAASCAAGMEPSAPGQFEDIRRWNKDVPSPMTVGKLLVKQELVIV